MSKLKVIQLLPELNFGGVERGTKDMSKALISEGHESIVISNGGIFEKDIISDGAKHIRLPVHKKSLFSLLLAKKLRSIYEKEQPDVIHVRSRMPAWINYFAFKNLNKKPLLISTFHGLIIGPTSKSKIRYLKKLNKKVVSLGITNNITFTGSRNDIANIYKISDIVFNLSIKPEPFGRTTIEAISCGTKVIGWNHGGTKEILDELFPNGLVTLGDFEALQDKVMTLSSNDTLPKVNTFTSSKMISETIKLYNQLVNKDR